MTKNLMRIIVAVVSLDETANECILREVALLLDSVAVASPFVRVGVKLRQTVG